MQMSRQSELEYLVGARRGDSQQFEALAEPYRRELRAYCYRLLGSLEDAEDLVQETMLRAWRRLETFEGRSSFRAWLYKIATNACLDTLDKAARRQLPNTREPESSIEDGAEMSSDPVWLDPFPDNWLDETTPSVEAHYSQRESVTLAFLTALQLLPPHQRVVLVLRDVLDWRASEAAELLDMTVSAVNSALHRARTTLAQHHRAALNSPALTEDDTIIRDLLQRYLQAWEAVDVTALVTLLKEDATFSMPPFPTWFQTREVIGAFFRSSVFTEQSTWRLLPIQVSGRAGFATYKRNSKSERYESHAIHVLDVDAVGIRDLTAFLNAALFPYFGLPETIEG